MLTKDPGLRPSARQVLRWPCVQAAAKHLLQELREEEAQAQAEAAAEASAVAQAVAQSEARAVAYAQAHAQAQAQALAQARAKAEVEAMDKAEAIDKVKAEAKAKAKAEAKAGAEDVGGHSRASPLRVALQPQSLGSCGSNASSRTTLSPGGCSTRTKSPCSPRIWSSVSGLAKVLEGTSAAAAGEESRVYGRALYLQVSSAMGGA
mmetsp:Transcript_87989/g.188760  ORF Transcript_87989/g.188760 Transcript_87989/m.188760 type:complete len:206 (+) Transcript_87989:2-619(+)